MSATDTLSALQFVNRVKETGGATMNIRSGRLVNPGTKVYMIGSQPDRAGVPIPSQKVAASEFGEQDVRRAMGFMSGQGATNIGAWQDEGSIYLDASGITTRKNKALKHGRERNEKEIWDNQHMQGINTGGRADK